jgi:hypothetical protein
VMRPADIAGRVERGQVTHALVQVVGVVRDEVVGTSR